MSNKYIVVVECDGLEHTLNLKAETMNDALVKLKQYTYDKILKIADKDFKEETAVNKSDSDIFSKELAKSRVNRNKKFIV